MNDKVNLLHPEVRANPYPIYAELRRNRPVCQVEPAGIWAVSRYDDVEYVLKNHDLFSSEAFQMMFKPPWLPHNPFGDSILVMDPPAHARRRALVSRAFTSRRLAHLEPRLQEIAGELAGRLQGLGEVDFVAEFAVPFPLGVIGEILGLDSSLHHHFKHWCHDLATISPAPPSEEFAASAQRTITDMERYLQEVVGARRREPRDDMVSDLIRAEAEGDTLTDAEIIAFLFLLLPAGFETAANLLTNSMLCLVDRPDVLARLRSDPALIPAFIDEVLRHDPSVHTIMRLTTTDVEVGGVTIPRGAMVAALLASANRDETRFSDPDRFDIDRDAQSGMAFGHGAHFCLGVALARMEGRIGIGTILSRFQRFTKNFESLAYSQSLTVRAPTTLPLRLVPA